MGGLRREAAQKRGMTLAEYNKLGESDPSTDLEVDNYQKELGKTKDNFIIEGRTSWYFIPNSLKIYIEASFKTGAERIFKQLQKENNRNEDHNLNSIEAVLKSLEERYKSDQLRYKKYFNIDVYNLKNYDFVIATDNLNIEEVFEKVFTFIANNKNKNKPLTKNK